MDYSVKVIRVSKRNAIYLPKEVVGRLNLKEGDKLVLVVRGSKIELIPVRKPEGYWAEVDPEEVERVGEALGDYFTNG